MNYTLIEEKKLDDLNGVGFVYEHKITKAKVCLIVNDDDNRVFSVTFRTPPTSDNGLPHILEHSVLCGSRKYPVKDPFIELARGSLNTFLNAMTFSDKTMYPLASTNVADFHNLMDVYLDAVFYPNIYDNPMILQQEGWHYDLENVEDDIEYKGVVYNEMKGAFSQAEQVLMRGIQQKMFEGHIYSNESGGDPKAIPSLSHEEFLDFHKTYYHPSNSYIFYYGDLNVEDELENLHNDYLKDFEEKKVDSSIPLMERYSEPKSYSMDYPIGKDESEDKKSYLSYNVLLNEAKETIDAIGFDILDYLLINAPGAPVKEALVKAGIGEDVFSSYDGYIKEGTFSIIAKNCNVDQEAEFISIIEAELQKIIDNGFEDKKVKAAINRFEFKTKEADFGQYPKGIMYAIKSLDTWLHDESPFLNFDYDGIFDGIKEGASNNLLIQLIDKYLLNNTHKTFVRLVPNKDFSDKKTKAVKEEIKAYADTLSVEDREKLVADTKALQAYQEEKDSEEALATIPMLTLEDIDREKKELSVKEYMAKDSKILYHDANASNIAYVKCGFDISFVDEERLPMVSLLSRILLQMSTSRHTYAELSDEVNLITGGIFTGVAVHDHKQSTKYFTPTLEISGKCFMENVDDMYKLMREILVDSDFSDVDRLKELINETKSRLQMSVYSSGHSTAILRASSYMSKVAAYKERLKGLYFLDIVSSWQDKSDDDIKELGTYLKAILNQIVTSDGLIMAVTSSKDYEESVINSTKEFIATLPNLDRDIVKAETTLIEPTNEGIKTTSDVQYVAMVANFKKHGFEYDGSLRVLNMMLSGEYLWNNVRIIGGAYGAFCNVARNGQMYFCSYRDPNLVETIKVYEEVHEYISGLDLSDRELVKYIIGSISQLDQPLTPNSENEKMLSMYHSEIGTQDILKNRYEILDTTKDQLKGHVELYQKILLDKYIAVVGSSDKIEKNQEIFNHTMTIS